MKFQSMIISRGSGSIGGLTASHNKGGNYFRARTTPTDPASVFQTAVRTIMAALVNDWENTLTQGQRDGWTTYAFNTPLLDQFGDPRTVTALNMFCRYNVPAIQSGLAGVDDAPADFNTGEFTNVAMVASAATGFAISFTPLDAWANETGSAMLFYASRPQNVGINFFKGPYRFVGTIDGDDVTPPTNPALFPAVPFALIAGQKVFGQVRVARLDGRLSVKQRLEAIVV